MLWRLDLLLGAGSGRRTGVCGKLIFLEAGTGLSSDIRFRLSVETLLLEHFRQQTNSSMTVLDSSS